jgi:membrane protease YdiL (CAAX protease family)
MSASPTNASSLQEHPRGKGIILPIVIGAAGIFMASYIAYLLQTGRMSLLIISTFKVVNFTFTMQLYILPLSFLGLLFLFVYDRSAFRRFFKFRLKTGDDNGSDWQTLGPIIAIAFTMGTVMLMYFNVSANHGTINNTFFNLFPLVVLFAATNAWTEEILSRFVIVAGLFGKIRPGIICWISAVVFGIPHFLGTPNGVFGVVMSGLLGWLLAKSVIETRSLGWALFIHFLQDMVIFGAGAMIVAGSI